MRGLRLGTLIGGLMLCGATARAADTVDFSGLGQVTVYQPSGPPKEVVLFVSGDGGWNQGVVSMAEHLVSEGALVAGVDMTQARKRMLGSTDSCIYPAGTFESLSHFLQQKFALKRYETPILVGYSSGATFVYATLVQAPVGTFKGAVALGFCPDLDWRKPMCQGEGLEHDPAEVGYVYRPAAVLRDRFIALQGEQDEVCIAQATREFVAQVPGAKFVLLPKVGHGYSVEKNWLPQFVRAYHDVADAPAAARPAAPDEVGDLPLVEVPARSTQRGLFAVMLSGDGGWAGLDRDVAAELATRGVAVVGWDSLRYFWTARTPESAARDLGRVIRYYARAWHKSSVLLIGYSQGADTMPFMVNRLRGEALRLVAATALIGVSNEAFFEFSLTHWLGTPTGGLPTRPELEQASLGRVLCIYGREESDSPCPTLAAPGLERIELPGGHHFDGDYSGVARAILAALPP